MASRQRVRTFLDGPESVLALVGPSGTGKLFTAQRAAGDKGLACVVHDRAQGVINYSRWGAPTLADGGLARALHILCNADSETDFSSLGRMPPGCKVVCIGNDARAMEKAKIPIERVKPLTQDGMAKILYQEQNWDAAAAQRLARLAQGDWRQLKTLARLFNDAGIDVSTQDEEEFVEACERMARDRKHDCHPSLRVHSIFNGSGRQEDREDPAVLPWGERNLGVTCETLESMVTMQEAAATADLLCNGGEFELGLDHFARSAACLGQTGLRYDYARFANPWSAPPATATIKAVRESVALKEPWTKRAKRRLGDEASPPDAPHPKAKAKRAARPRRGPAAQ